MAKAGGILFKPVLNSLITFKPDKNIPVLTNGSYMYRLNQQKMHTCGIWVGQGQTGPESFRIVFSSGPKLQHEESGALFGLVAVLDRHFVP